MKKNKNKKRSKAPFIVLAVIAVALIAGYRYLGGMEGIKAKIRYYTSPKTRAILQQSSNADQNSETQTSEPEVNNP